ncbi:MAG: hypothetical protein R3F29_05500 [Planctomycetota bacterium]
MASRTPSRSGRSGGRSSSSSRGRSSSGGNNQMPMILGGVGVVVVIILLVVMNQGGGSEKKSDKDATPAKPAAAAPAMPTVQVSGAAAGKTPSKPAPALTADMLGQVQKLLDEATALQNQGATLRTNGDNQGARDVQSQAAAKLETLRNLIDNQLTWQEEAEMEGWAQPGEYVTLGKMWTKIAKLEKAVRMGGGTR